MCQIIDTVYLAPAFRGAGKCRAAARKTAARWVQHLQGLQVQGLQRHPPLAGAGAGVAACLVSTVVFMGFLLGLPSGESVYNLSTVVRSQAA